MDPKNLLRPETQNSLTAIKLWGFDGALDVAYYKAISDICEMIKTDRPKAWLDLGKKYLDDARKNDFSPGIMEQNLMLARFYRKLAQRTYKYAVKYDSEYYNPAFIQEA